ncbi:MAG: 4'-phosphopantetheinyl transferase family protein [Thermomicrobiales bacterium]
MDKDCDCDHIWGVPPTVPVLDDDAVQVWRAFLDVAPERVAALHRTLAVDERARAERFRFPIDHARFIVARGLLRAIIARYLDREPGAITFQYSTSGKPSLRDEASSGLRFNVSHADDIALYAVTHFRAVGVDIEGIRADMASERIAERFFSPREVATLRALHPDLQRDAFFRCWTRKEAYVKARGTGITAALDQFDVSLAPGEPAMILESREAGAARHRWSLHHLTPGPGYVGAVARESESDTLTCWQWQEPSDRHQGDMCDEQGPSGRRPLEPAETRRQRCNVSDLSWNTDPILASPSCHTPLIGACHGNDAFGRRQ